MIRFTNQDTTLMYPQPVMHQPIRTAIGATLLLAATMAHAQSGYTVNTLTGMTYAGDMRERLDNSNIAYGNLPRFSLSGYLVGSIGGPADETVPRAAKWNTSTAVTVAASNRFSSTYMVTQAVSDDGVWQGLWSSYDSTTKRAKGVSITNAPSVNRSLNGTRYSATIRDINNLGQMVGTQYEQSNYQPYYWASNQGVRLDCGGCYSAMPMTINNRSEIGGWMIPPFTPGVPVPTVAVIWRNGSVAWTGDPQVFGSNARGVAMNDAGTLVVQSLVNPRSFTVSASGTVLQLSPQASNVVATDINAAGVVVGEADGRAVMWVNGQPIDLAAHLAAKGVSQANTWKWTRIHDINDKGSMLVYYTDAQNKVGLARLTAKP
jgi:hypothetical protein